ncbi:MAG: carbohydrate ABC transporter permease [Sphaerochaeta sp.]|jgi:putative aldouronate transport system permease protein|nr:carbohydrate ABC transporter permease [Sphaerochaeta sp.]MDX9915040.1 carbohydrate ABC transporter permease [Sphaerochaeta sp.]
MKKAVHQRTVSVAIKPTAADHSFNLFVDIFLLLLLIIIAIPLWSTITLSFRPYDYIGNNLQGMFLAPWKWSPAAYRALLGNAGFLLAFKNSFKILIGGVATALVLTIPLAYVLSIPTLPGRRVLGILVILPYVFNVGMIPSYLLVTNIGLIDKLPAVYLPGAISTYNCLIMRSFFEGIPNELKESARIDGATEIQVLGQIILPLSKAIIMTIGLFYGVSFWNDFFHAMLYLNSNSLQPLPILLRNILMASGMNEYVEVSAFGDAPIAAIKAASVFMSAIPMVIAYPFIQKYFTKGTLLGSVKG